MEKTIFQLIRLGLGTSTLEQEDISILLSYTEDKWFKLKGAASIQGVSAIVLDGLQVIINKLGSDCFARALSFESWRKFILQWIGEVQQQYEAGNLQQALIIDTIQRQWAQSGIQMMLMKGQALATYYPEPKHRCPGDIDCYLFDNYSKGNEVARKWADKVDESWYKHSVISYHGQSIENHQFFVHTREGRISKELNKHLCALLDDCEFEKLAGTEVLLPPPMFNALFLTYHAMAHFLEEGLRLKQLVDWALFLKRDCEKIDWNLFYSWCNKYHFHRFVNITNDFAVNYLGVKLDNLLITTESKYTTRVLDSTLNDGDYVFNGNGGWSNRLNIVKNLIKYRWKYHQIYQHSIVRQLWYYFTGFFFGTEN